MSGVPTVGFVGLGSMGMPIARRVAGAGFVTRVYARKPEVARTAEEFGAEAVPSLAALANASDVVVVNVFTDDQLREVCLGPEALVANLRPGAVLVDHVTGRPSTVQEIAAAASERGVDVLDCAQSGGPQDIDAGRLTLLVGGIDEVLETVRPVLASYSDPIIPVGAVGDAQTVKLLNNALFGAHVALALRIEQAAVSVGLDPRRVLDALRACSGDSYAVEVAGMIGSAAGLVEAARRYIEKDVAVCAEVAAELGVDLGSVLETAREI